MRREETGRSRAFVGGFSMKRPEREIHQEELLRWLARIHGEAEARRASLGEGERRDFEERLERVLARVGCPASKITRRGALLPDIGEPDPSRRLAYDTSRSAHGAAMGLRSELFTELVGRYFEEEYSRQERPPADLIHVTCTGFVSPSAAQRLVERRGWGARTRVTHAYQMGCYAALPALRIARGFLVAQDVPAGAEARVDVVHTELASLHLDPCEHGPEQLVVQSLFGDGLIRYRVEAEERPGSLEILALDEVIVEDTEGAMSWSATEWGMRMTLARDVPDLIADRLRPFVARLLDKAQLSPAQLRGAPFAIHPGGPKIIDRVERLLELSEAQVRASRGVLADYGNMSSATLPHVWMRLAQDPTVPRGVPLVSLAFGPGLTICGGVFVQR